MTGESIGADKINVEEFCNPSRLKFDSMADKYFSTGVFSSSTAVTILVDNVGSHLNKQEVER